MIFANAQGRFVLATSEKLMAQTLSNIEGKEAKNRLTDEPLFAALSEQIESRLATVWVNQTALNADYYFKRYWLMPDAENLKNIRAGIFDFSIEEGKFVERRRFLLDKAIDASPIERAQVAETLSLLPADVPFYRLRKAGKKTLDEAVRNTIFDRREREEKPEDNRRFYGSSFSDFGDSSGGDYDYLSEKFDETIDEDNETAISKEFSEETTISAAGVPLKWETKNENGAMRRELQLPMLGISACYAVRGSELILTNDAEFLQVILENQNSQRVENSDAPFTELTVLNLDRKENAYTSVFAELAERDAADDFFTGNVASLIDSAADVKKIEIKANSSHNVLEQVVTAYFR